MDSKHGENHIEIEAYSKWEAEGRPEGQHERHWREAQQEHGSHGALPQTWSADHGGGVAASTPPRSFESEEGIRPQNLNKGNDQGSS